ncbi:MAG: radical SAM protein, partial [Candidatus Aenigmarchaeota archaeon]|nr:radical SAM protein [Candidatus Aenigmarchaeota archaeon]
FFNCRPKKDVIKKLVSDLNKVDKNFPVSVSNSSDPYVPEEEKLKLTRNCLRYFALYGCKILIITKSNLVLRDLDIISRMKCCVSLTITTLNEELAKKLEPRAPLPKKRVKAVEKLVEKGIPTLVRLDPIIPFLNEEEIDEIVEISASIGVKQIVSSTYKARQDNWKRLSLAFPEIFKKLEELYFKKGERISNSFYLPKELRFKIMKRVKDACDKNKLSFSCCREGFFELNNSKSCDGTHLIK